MRIDVYAEREPSHLNKQWRVGLSGRGFTLIELIVILAVLGILSVVALPTFINETLPHMRLQETAREIYVALQQARGKAAGSMKDYAIQFDLDASPQTYRLVYRDSGASLWSNDPSFAPREAGKSVVISKVGSSTSGTVEMLFTPLGTSNGGTVYLQKESDSSDKYSVIVFGVTGRVRIQKG